MGFFGRVIDARTDEQGQVIIVMSEDRPCSVRPLDGLMRPPGTFVRVDGIGDEGKASVRTIADIPGRRPDPEGDLFRWRRPGVSLTRMEFLRRRQEIIRAIRDDLHGEGFLEVQTPLLARGGCPDTHIESFSVSDRYLVTSTEYQLKRMIAGGFDRVFTLTQNFRRGESGPWHNPEFTMLEWARAFEPLDAIEADAARFVRAAFARLCPGQERLRYGEKEIDLFGPWERLPVRTAIESHLGVRIDPDFSLPSMKEGCGRAGLELPKGVDADPLELITYLLVELQPRLGWRAPTFLCDWPSFMTSSAGLSTGNPRVAERSELFIAGIEIADGFPSLRDPAVQRETFGRELAKRRAAGKEPVEPDLCYLDALEQGLPPGAGMALGVDRLVMVLTGARELRQVLAFAWDEL